MYDQKTLDTPNNVNIRADQLRQRQELGRRQHEMETHEEDPKCFGESFIFRLRQYKNTSFAGLWELARLDKKGAVVNLITDADALTNAVAAIGNILEEQGF